MGLAGRIRLLTFAFLLMCGVNSGHEQSQNHNQRTAEPIEDILVKAATNKQYDDFFWDNEEKLILTEYDMVLTHDQWAEHYADVPDGLMRTAGVIPHKGADRWTDGVVHYQINWTDFSSNDIQVINAAMAEWEDFTCLKFKYSDTQQNRILFTNGSVCSSHVGMQSKVQKLTLAPQGCRHKRTVLHELGHALGFHHEHNRPDRDNHVTILFGNVSAGNAYNFNKMKSWKMVDLGMDYDYDSIMHYSSHAFSKNGQLTIVTKDPEYQETIGTSGELSFGDIKAMNLMYGCDKNPECKLKDSECPKDGFVGPDCHCWCPTKWTTARYCSEEDRRNKGHIVHPEVVVKCEDTNARCSDWAKDDYCTNGFRTYMKHTCPKVCKFC